MDGWMDEGVCVCVMLVCNGGVLGVHASTHAGVAVSKSNFLEFTIRETMIWFFAIQGDG